jgi:anti-sigma factor RsiW
MDAQPSPHPTLETLRAYALGKVEDGSALMVREHLEHCSDCRHQAAEMLPDSFLGRIRDAGKNWRFRTLIRQLPAGRGPTRQRLTVSRSILPRAPACLPRGRSTRPPPYRTA